MILLRLIHKFAFFEHQTKSMDEINRVLVSQQPFNILLIVQIARMPREGQYSQLPQMIDYPCVKWQVLRFLGVLDQSSCAQSELILSISHSIRFWRLMVGWKQSARCFSISSICSKIYEDSSPGKPNLRSTSYISLIQLQILDCESLIMLFEYLIMIVKNLISLARTSLLPTSLTQQQRYHAGEEKNDYGIKYDQQKIKLKMEEIKKRKEAERAKRTQKIEFMHTNPQSEISRKIRKYRESTNTENLLHFTDPSLQQKPTTLQITGYDQNSIEIDNMVYPPCMIIFRTQMFVWEVLGVQALTLDDFIILKYITPKPTYVVVGINQPEKFPNALKEQLVGMVQNFDVLALFEATSQYNVTSSDDIDVVMFMISK